MFSYINIFHQCDGELMNSSLDSVLANVILTELENFVVTCFMENGFLKFPCRYANDVSVLHKEDQIDRILKAFN